MRIRRPSKGRLPRVEKSSHWVLTTSFPIFSCEPEYQSHDTVSSSRSPKRLPSSSAPETHLVREPIEAVEVSELLIKGQPNSLDRDVALRLARLEERPLQARRRDQSAPRRLICPSPRARTRTRAGKNPPPPIALQNGQRMSTRLPSARSCAFPSLPYIIISGLEQASQLSIKRPE